MVNRRFNNQHKNKRCPICGYSTGKLLPQESALRDLGHPTSHYAHVICVVNEREKRKVKQ